MMLRLSRLSPKVIPQSPPDVKSRQNPFGPEDERSLGRPSRKVGDMVRRASRTTPPSRVQATTNILLTADPCQGNMYDPTRAYDTPAQCCAATVSVVFRSSLCMLGCGNQDPGSWRLALY